MGNVVDSKGNPVRDSKGNPVTSGSSPHAGGVGTSRAPKKSTITPNVSVSLSNGRISINASLNKTIQSISSTGNNIKSPLRQLFSPSPKYASPIVYPMDLDDEHYMVFNVVKSARGSKQAAAAYKPIRSIVLPIPSNLQTAYKVGYDNTGLGVAGAMAAGRVGGSEIGAAFNDVTNLIKQRFTTAASNLTSGDTDTQMDEAAKLAGTAAPAAIAGLGALGAGAIGAALGLGVNTDQVINGVLLDQGIAINPHMAVLFKGVDFRTHDFNYRFIARGTQESYDIQYLIDTLRYYMHPNYIAGTLAFDYPEEFQIAFGDKVAPFMYSFQPCVLTSFGVNYNGENTPIFFEETGAPVIVDIQMSFQETRINTKEDISPSGAPSRQYAGGGDYD